MLLDAFYNLFFLPKIQKRLFYISLRPVIPTCRTPIEKKTVFYPRLKSIMQNGKFYIRYSIDCTGEIKNNSFIPAGTLLVTARPYPNISHGLGLKALREDLEKKRIAAYWYCLFD